MAAGYSAYGLFLHFFFLLAVVLFCLVLTQLMSVASAIKDSYPFLEAFLLFFGLLWSFGGVAAMLVLTLLGELGVWEFAKWSVLILLPGVAALRLSIYLIRRDR